MIGDGIASAIELTEIEGQQLFYPFGNKHLIPGRPLLLAGTEGGTEPGAAWNVGDICRPAAHVQ